MSEAFAGLVALAAGAGLGVVFFGGLWWTIRKGVSAQRSGLWYMTSMLLRTSIVLTGFFFVAAGNWQRLLLCLTGFVMARLMVLHVTRPVHEPARTCQEVNHAS